MALLPIGNLGRLQSTETLSRSGLYFRHKSIPALRNVPVLSTLQILPVVTAAGLGNGKAPAAGLRPTSTVGQNRKWFRMFTQRHGERRAFTSMNATIRL
jgi:hypothetical protein